MNENDGNLYEVLRIYRNGIFTQYETYYTNAELELFATRRPTDRQTFLEISPAEQEFRKYGAIFLKLIKVFSGLNTSTEDITGFVREKLVFFETQLHQLVMTVLKRRFDKNWWYEGVPESVRLGAAEIHEKSKGEIPKHNALFILGLLKIVISNWNSFSEYFDPENCGKRDFQRRVEEINDLRNRVNHPIRLEDSPLTDADVVILEEQVSFLKEAVDRLTSTST